MLTDDLQRVLDEIQKEIHKAFVIADLLGSMGIDPPLEGTIQDAGSYICNALQKGNKLLDDIRSSLISILNKEYPDASLSDNQ